MSGDIHREADDLARYYSELGRRLTQAGIRDVPELLALHERVRKALEMVSAQEIGWALEQAQRLIERLAAMDGMLSEVRRLKAQLEGAPPAGAPGD